MPTKTPEGKPDPEQEGKPDPEDGNNPDGNANDPAKEELDSLKEQVTALADLVKKQSEFLSKLSDLGGEPETQKTDSEKLDELQNTVRLLTQKLEADAEEQRKVELQAKEELVDSIIKDQPTFKAERDNLLKAPGSVLKAISKNKPPETSSPLGKGGGQGKHGDDWAKKIAAATQRRQERTASRKGIGYK